MQLEDAYELSKTLWSNEIFSKYLILILEQISWIHKKSNAVQILITTFSLAEWELLSYDKYLSYPKCKKIYI